MSIMIRHKYNLHGITQKQSMRMKKTIILSNVLIVLVFLLTSALPQRRASASGTATLPILFGAYASADLQSAVGELTAMNSWLTKNGANGVTFAGDFMSITFNPKWNVPHELDAAWDAGFMPFVNLTPSESWEGSYYDSKCDTTSDIANGTCDGRLQTWADLFKTWAGSSKRAFIAPLPEVNGDWAGYSSDGPTFIQAFIRIRQIFENAGVPRRAVRWVFAPNGWSNPAEPWKQFENYYPGDAYTDIISFSAYNYGGCVANPQWHTWDTFESGYKPFLDRMRVMAPSKPIFIAQIGVTGVPDPDDPDPNQTKSAWTSDTFAKLAAYPAVRGIIYFNKINTTEVVGNCAPPDYRIYYGGSSGESGFLNIMKDSRFGRWTLDNSKWETIAFVDQAYTFADVPGSHPFSGESNVWYYQDVHTLYRNSITGGCATNPLMYCPENTVTRAQMAVFLERGMKGASYTPPGAAGNVFGDVSRSYWAAAWIEQLARDGITSGCGAGNYCPEAAVTRAQMAIFLLRAEHGTRYVPPPASGLFSDVPTGYWAAAWIEQLAQEGITGGCGTGIYCPESPVTRAQMAVFLVKTFNLK